MSELQLFKIENFIGGDQNWFTDYWMKRGGCGAVTACDICIYFAMFFGEKNLYPYDLTKVTKQDYINFSAIMKPYLAPRIHGIDKLEIFIDGFNEYLHDKKEEKLRMRAVYSDCSLNCFKEDVRKQIDGKMPVPYLNLKHKNPRLRNYVWHWFWLAGYEEFENNFMVKVITYGRTHWLSLNQLWDSGYEQKGGIVLLDMDKEKQV
ncbi:hypothetical protein [Pectinatus cerevisiiphilus]|uniref:Uncharacterized protein n=1 Tax=Pectinatus cerevisiiphilus TaxID=86956 RepID=A0A4R3KCF4_9FIRM|nr:hypothetical protein [Pectinatus cerevisiiphilus]TCS80904.1 hypothetical protein EDC37_10373 [Pectinatus cerevisiiphilus]